MIPYPETCFAQVGSSYRPPLSALASSMPVVTRDSVNATYQINLVTSGQIRQISAYLPEDQNALVIITNMRDFKGKPAKGIGFTADMTLKQGAWPGDFAALAGDTGTAHAVPVS